MYMLHFLNEIQFLMLFPHFFFINKMFLKNSKSLWKHGFSNKIFGFANSLLFRDFWVCAQVYEWNLTKFAKFEYLYLNTYNTNFGVPPRCFCSYRLWLNKSNHRVKHVNISESNDINQSISMNRFCSIKALIFIREVFVFL